MAIKNISLNKLPNAFHFDIIMKTLERIGASSVPQQNPTLRPLFDELMTRFQREDNAYKQTLKNFKTDQIRLLDENRDKYAGCLRRVAEEWAKLPDEGHAAAGKLIVQVFKNYKFREREARIAETAKLLNMIQVFEDEEHSAALVTIGGHPLLQALSSLNMQVKQMTTDRTTEQAEYLVGELRAARLDVDETYAKVIEYLNALLIITPSEEVQQPEKVLNADIRLMEAQLAAGKKRPSSSSDGNNGNNGNDGSDGGTTVISNEDTIQGLE